ncbi:hypothetical protein [Spongiactinospora sp. TRM90649]|uniref:hypothetical protein n=1 Tax=Spongiactinospora sp. TRM90649 TaxID=3031114 RepID=UPI0023F6BA4A|nr:hypothetical protein [Spongiactinospora sp. TRM90649]
MTPPGTSDELKAAVAARRDLGPDYEDAIVEGFLEKVDSRIEQRVAQEMAARNLPRPPGQARANDNQGLALAIVSLIFGTGTSTVAIANDAPIEMMLLIWLGIVAVNVAFVLSRRRT